MILYLSVQAGFGQSEITDTAFFQQTTAPLTIDGVGDDPIWQSLAPVPVNKLVMGVIDDPADFDVSFKACWDENNMYFLWEMR